MNSPYNAGFTVFMKNGGASAACPAPCLRNRTFREEALKRLRQSPSTQYSASMVWNDEVYPTGETLSSTVATAPLEVGAGKALNISGLLKTTWFQRPSSGDV